MPQHQSNVDSVHKIGHCTGQIVNDFISLVKPCDDLRNFPSRWLKQTHFVNKKVSFFSEQTLNLRLSWLPGHMRAYRLPFPQIYPQCCSSSTLQMFPVPKKQPVVRLHQTSRHHVGHVSSDACFVDSTRLEFLSTRGANVCSRGWKSILLWTLIQ